MRKQLKYIGKVRTVRFKYDLDLLLCVMLLMLCVYSDARWQWWGSTLRATVTAANDDDDERSVRWCGHDGCEGMYGQPSSHGPHDVAATRRWPPVTRCHGYDGHEAKARTPLLVTNCVTVCLPCGGEVHQQPLNRCCQGNSPPLVFTPVQLQLTWPQMGGEDLILLLLPRERGVHCPTLSGVKPKFAPVGMDMCRE